MNIGIIFYSQTGHTLEVVSRLQTQLTAAGHRTQLERLQTVGPTRNPREISFAGLPEVGQYEALVIASPVHGGSPAPAMLSCLAQLPSLTGKRVALLVTQSFPFPALGGNQTVGKLRRLCKQKGAAVGATAIINWSSRRRPIQISAAIEQISGTF